MARRGGHGLLDHVRRGRGEAGEDAAGVKPTHPERPEQMLPVHVARPKLRGGRVAPVGHAERAAHAEAALGEVEPVAHGASDPVVGHPPDQRRVDPSLEDEVLEQVSDVVVGEGGHHRSPHSEATAQSAGDVVLAAPLPDPEGARVADALLPRVEAEHDLAERDQVVPALLGGAELEDAHGVCPRASASAVNRSTSAQFPAASSGGATIQLPPIAMT